MTQRPLLHRFAPALCTYAGGLVIGLTLVSFPASSVVLRALHHFSNEQYGAIYIPQLAASVLGALAGGAIERRLSLRGMFLIALACFAIAEALLAASSLVAPSLALLLIMMGTASFGFGFGFGGGPLNAFAALLFPARQGAAVTALHMCAGAGLTVAPVFFAALADRGMWIAGPGLLAVVSGLLFLIALSTRFPIPDEVPGDTVGNTRHPGRTIFFWACAAAAMLYSVAEGTFSNWATVFLTEERGLAARDAALALTCFWAAITGGRLLASLIAVRLPPILFLAVLPCAMAAALLLLPHVEGSGAAYAGFGLAGLACSAFFPMLVAFTAARTPRAISWIASMLTAAMMVGVGIGSYAVGALRGATPIARLYGQAIVAPLACLACVAIAFTIARRSRS
ncbi:MFS transporter [Flavisphingomonas formosensis]|uniref:MFS transporter n=1 Tax=Flavisphingomonas formosensis TaxID=861534 RepID=UPI0012F71848|nr:MFS transporter [Sphingomonas formosensis]